MAATDGLPYLLAEPPELATGIGVLPTRLRLLCVGSVEPSWVSLTLQLDALGCVEPNFKWVSTANEALALLRDESFDCLLVRVNPGRQGPADDPLVLARGIRAGGCADPIVIVTVTTDDETWAEALRLNVALLVSIKGWESSALVPAIQRAVERGRMLHEIDRLTAADRRRLIRERDEAEYLLTEQKQILAALEHLSRSAPTDGEVPAATESGGNFERLKLPPEFDNYYQELLRTYVIMGSGNLVAEIVKLANLMSQAGLTPRAGFDLHLAAARGLGPCLGHRRTRPRMAPARVPGL